MIMNALGGAIWHSHFLLKNAKRISKYKEHIDKVKYDKKDIPKIENMNNIRFNVFGVDDEQSIYPLYSSKKNVIKLAD